MDDIKTNLKSIYQKINQSALISKRLPEEINLVAVSKTVNIETIEQAIQNGCCIFGENRISEAKNKWPILKEKYPEVKLHLIGHLQTNKVKEAVKLFDVIETLDSEKLAQILSEEIIKQNRSPEIFIQINIGEESQKTGIYPQDITAFINMTTSYKLKITGLMCIPPQNEDPSMYFALLTKLARTNNLPNISMGMSNDYETAITLGANFIRIGSAIFGERK